MSKPDRPQPASSRRELPGESRSTLARAMGGLPAPPRLAKLPAPHVSMPSVPSHARPAMAKPSAPQVAKPGSSAAARHSVAGRLGTFIATPLKSAPPPSGGSKKRR